VRVQDEIAHMGIVDGRLGPGLPGLSRFGIVGEGPDELDLGQMQWNDCLLHLQEAQATIAAFVGAIQ